MTEDEIEDLPPEDDGVIGVEVAPAPIEQEYDYDVMFPKPPPPPPVVIPWVPGITGLIDLGPATPGAVKRMANYVSEIQKQQIPVPDSPFCQWAAKRVTGTDRQDLIIFIQGRRGSGKSYTALWLGYRIAQEISKVLGGDWGNYFSLAHVATLEDTDRVMQILEGAGKYQIVIVDDCSLAVSNRSWNSPQNRNFNALMTVARTNRWILLLTAPLKKHVDNQVREMCDITMNIYKSFHAGGFNLVKINSSEIGFQGKEYNRRMGFGKRKIDFWVSLKPPQELIVGYDKQRDQSALDVNRRIIETGSFRNPVKRPKPKHKVREGPTLHEQNVADQAMKYELEIQKFIADDPGTNVARLASYLGIHQKLCLDILGKLKIRLKKTKHEVKHGAFNV